MNKNYTNHFSTLKALPPPRTEFRLINGQLHRIPYGMKYMHFEYLWNLIVWELTKEQRKRAEFENRRRQIMQKYINEHNWYAIGDGDGTGLYSLGEK